jgi:hypothetical protein
MLIVGGVGLMFVLSVTAIKHSKEA